ncbi:MAG: ATP-binding protein [Oscillochloridaceae bacterium umkhey_bin13]
MKMEAALQSLNQSLKIQVQAATAEIQDVYSKAAQTLRENLKRVNILYAISQSAIAASNMQSLLQQMADIIAQAMHADRVNIAEHLHKLFQPFTQIDSSLARGYTGTGLGLSLVRHLVDLHNGSVSVESTFGAGSRFTVTLPCLPPITADAPVERQSDDL